MSAAALRALHVPGRPLVLPNAWDAASARRVEAAGFAAVATSSAALTESLGHADGEAAPADEVFAAVAAIARVVTVPVTADVERGYGLPPAELVARLTGSGASGCNLEDSDPRTGAMIDAAEQARWLAAVRDAAGPGPVLNARIDVFLRKAGDPARRLADALERAAAYRAAGADCVYPIGLDDPAALAKMAAAGPVNASARIGGRSVAELAALGVARISYGPGLFRAVQRHLDGLLAEIAGS